MGLTDSKLFLANFDLELLDGITSQYARTGLIRENLSIQGITKEGSKELPSSGETVHWEGGRDLRIEVFLEEIDPVATTGDLTKINASNKITITDTDNSRVMTVDSCHVIANIEDNGTRIIIRKSNPTQKEWSDLMTAPVGT